MLLHRHSSRGRENSVKKHVWKYNHVASHCITYHHSDHLDKMFTAAKLQHLFYFAPASSTAILGLLLLFLGAVMALHFLYYEAGQFGLTFRWATDIYLDPSGGDAQKTFQSTRLYATLPGHSGLMLFQVRRLSPRDALNLFWFVNEKKVVMWKRAEILMEIGLCEVWVCSSSMLGLDCFSAVNSSRLFWWIMLGTQILSLIYQYPCSWRGLQISLLCEKLWVLLQSWSSKIHITQALAYGYHVTAYLYNS